jgi:hypothetical protein
MIFSESVFQPSIYRMMMRPDASNTETSMAAVSAHARRLCVLMHA